MSTLKHQEMLEKQLSLIPLLTCDGRVFIIDPDEVSAIQVGQECVLFIGDDHIHTHDVRTVKQILRRTQLKCVSQLYAS